jgi:hypothetical protein
LNKNPKLGLDIKKPNILHNDLEDIRAELNNEKIARMIGLIAHLVYWNVFGHLNSLPLDTYHKKLLFIQIAQIQADLDNKYAGKKILGVLHMPMLILCIRIIIENIFKNTYSEFFSKEQHEQVRFTTSKKHNIDISETDQ